MEKDPTRSGTRAFLRAELRTAHTFALIAEQASHQDKINRNRKNARKAYESVRHYSRRISLSEDESNEFEDKLVELERRLQLLDEAVI